MAFRELNKIEIGPPEEYEHNCNQSEVDQQSNVAQLRRAHVTNQESAYPEGRHCEDVAYVLNSASINPSFSSVFLNESLEHIRRRTGT